LAGERGFEPWCHEPELCTLSLGTIQEKYALKGIYNYN
jgi:hypothetical protein